MVTWWHVLQRTKNYIHNVTHRLWRLGLHLLHTSHFFSNFLRMSMWRGLHFITYFEWPIRCKHYSQISHLIGSWSVLLKPACFDIWKQTIQQLLGNMSGWWLTVQCQVTVLLQLPGTGSSLKATARVWVAGARGVKLTRNSAPPSGSTLVGRCSPAPSCTTSSRLPSPAAAASTRLGYLVLS